MAQRISRSTQLPIRAQQGRDATRVAQEADRADSSSAHVQQLVAHSKSPHAARPSRALHDSAAKEDPSRDASSARTWRPPSAAVTTGCNTLGEIPKKIAANGWIRQRSLQQLAYIRLSTPSQMRTAAARVHTLEHSTAFVAHTSVGTPVSRQTRTTAALAVSDAH